MLVFTINGVHQMILALTLQAERWIHMTLDEDSFISMQRTQSNIVFTSPYINPTFGNYIATLSQSVFKNSQIYGVLNSDLNLSFSSQKYHFLDYIDKDILHFYIVSRNSTPLYHSLIDKITSENTTLVQLEFSNSNVPLNYTPDTQEVRDFQNIVLPTMLNATTAKEISYSRFSEMQVAAVAPFSNSFYNENTGKFQNLSLFIAGIAIRENVFQKKILDESDLLTEIIKWVLIFSAIFILILIITAIIIFKIANRALLPIRWLNKKVKTLMISNADFDFEANQKNITSKELYDIYECISELITARRFTRNDFIKQDDTIAIMGFADAYTVLDTNLQARGICLTNIAHIYYKNKDYIKAAKSYKEAADCAKEIFTQAKENMDFKIFKKNVYLYCKRKYYFAVCSFHKVKEMNSDNKSEEFEKLEALITSTKDLLK